jgi:alpha-tubulin suppressor-like RCC1 family protein
MGAGLPPISLGAKAVLLTVGAEHACALLEGNLLKCWGSNAQGQLGRRPGEPQAIGSAPGSMGVSLPAVALVRPGEVVSRLSAGSKHTCVGLGDGSVRCFGDDQFGQLGRAVGGGDVANVDFGAPQCSLGLRR